MADIEIEGRTFSVFVQSDVVEAYRLVLEQQGFEVVSVVGNEITARKDGVTDVYVAPTVEFV